MGKTLKQWTAEEELILLPFINSKMHYLHAAPLLPNRTISAIQTKWWSMKKEGPKHIGAAGQAEPSQTFSYNRRQDERFQLAMRKAIKEGLEKAPIGVYVAADAETWWPRHQPAYGYARSFCSSPAADCAEIGS